MKKNMKVYSVRITSINGEKDEGYLLIEAESESDVRPKALELVYRAQVRGTQVVLYSKSFTPRAIANLHLASLVSINYAVQEKSLNSLSEEEINLIDRIPEAQEVFGYKSSDFKEPEGIKC